MVTSRFLLPIHLFDFESPEDNNSDNRYELTVQVTDGNDSASLNVVVQVNDVFESSPNNPPYFQSDGNFSVLENQAFVFDFNATDPDGDPLSYSIAYGDDAHKFELVAAGGFLAFNYPPDFESPEDNNSDNRYELTIQVTDGNDSASLNVVVQVNDVFESSPNYPPHFQSDGNFSVPENQAFVFDFNATDPDGDPLSYSIAYGDDAHKFELVAASGLLAFTYPPDFESPEDNNSDNRYELTIQVTDGNDSASLNVVVQVNDVFESSPNYPPHFQSDGNFSVPENQAFVFDFNATDPDGDPLSYSIAYGDDAHKFELIASTGLLAFTYPPDFESPEDNNSDNRYELTIQVTDGNDSASLNVVVQVNDVFESSPNPVDLNMSLGLPVFDLSYQQVNQLTNGYLTIDGTYAFEFFFDPITNFESKRLVKAIFYDGNWSREFDPITNDFLFTDIDSIAFPYIHEIELYLSHQNLQPIGHIHEYQEEENYPEVPFIFESIKKVELSDREQLLSIVKDYEYLFFQTYKFNHNNLTPENNTISDSNYYYKDSITHESGLNEHSIVWALSIEDAKENEISDLVIDMEGNVFKGHFVDFWRDGYGVLIKDNPDWNETEYQNDSIGIEKLYTENHEYLIGSTAIPGMENNDEGLQPVLVQTISSEFNGNEVYNFKGKILSSGNSPVTEVGFILSPSIRFEFPTRIIGGLQNPKEFSATYNNLAPNQTYYFRSYAINQSGESWGSIKRFKTKSFNSWQSDSIDLEAGWKSSDWFGAYLPLQNDWIYHQDIGWAYTSPDSENGLWLWTQEHNWQWTSPDVWPFLYLPAAENWLYFLKRIDGVPVFFDYSENKFLMPAPLAP